MCEDSKDREITEVQSIQKVKPTRKKEAKPNIIEQHNTSEDIQGVAVSFLQAVGPMEDPRTRPCDAGSIATRKSPLHEILFIAVCSVLCGTESHEDMATFGDAQIDWFRQFIPLKNGVPSHDTFRRVLVTVSKQLPHFTTKGTKEHEGF